MASGCFPDHGDYQDSRHERRLVFALPRLVGLPLQPYAGYRPRSRPAASSSRSGHVNYFRKPVMMSVVYADHCDSDSYIHNHDHWTTILSCWEIIFQVSESF